MTGENSSEINDDKAPLPKGSQAASKAQKPPSKVTPYVPSGLEVIMHRNNFYRNNYRRMVSFSLFLLLIICGLVGFIFYQHHTRPTPKYFATSEDGKILEIIPLNRISLTQNELFEWSVEAAKASYTYDFVNYRKELQDAKRYYTGAGHRSLLAAIEASTNLQAVIQKKMTTSARITGTPYLKQRQGIANPRLENQRVVWEVELPMEVIYTNGRPQDNIIQRILVTMMITRVPIWDSSMGIGINSIVVRENYQDNAEARNNG